MNDRDRIRVAVATARLPEPAREWCRAHPEFVTDPRLNAKAQAAHFDAIAEGAEEFSPEYFDKVERKLGLRDGRDRDRARERQRREPALSAREMEAAKISFPEEWREDPKKALAEYLKNKAALKREGRMDRTAPVV